MSQEVHDYLSVLPEDQRAALQGLRQVVSQILPESVESMSTNVPAFYYKGKYLVSFGAAKGHIALFVMQGDAMKSLAKELEGYDTGSRVIRFTPASPLPVQLVERVVRFRQAEIDAKLKAD